MGGISFDGCNIIWLESYVAVGISSGWNIIRWSEYHLVGNIIGRLEYHQVGISSGGLNIIWLEYHSAVGNIIWLETLLGDWNITRWLGNIIWLEPLFGAQTRIGVAGVNELGMFSPCL